jgi:hypothetical protein
MTMRVRSWQPTGRQSEVLDAIAAIPHEEYGLIGYGGAAGGGKSNLLANVAWDIALACPGSRTLVGRNEFVHLRDTTLLEFDACRPPFLEVKTRDSAPVHRQVRLPHWPADVYSHVQFQGVKDARDGIGSAQYGWVLLDEAHEIAETDVRYLFSRLRHKPERKRGMILCFNPFPSCATEWFMGGEGLPDDLQEIGAIHQVFIPARVQDNPHVPANYAAMMYAGLDPYLRAVLLEGKGEAVPHAIYGELHDPELQKLFQVRDRSALEEVRLTYGATGWDWGTSKQHQAAGVLLAEDNHGLIWTLDAWESPYGSSDELSDVAGAWQHEWGLKPSNGSAAPRGFRIAARYDASQGSLADPLAEWFPDVDKGLRDVEGRIRIGRGLVSTKRLRFAWWNPEVRKLWRYLTLYHRDEDGRIVEVLDDMVDAWHYAIAALERGVMQYDVRPIVQPLHPEPRPQVYDHNSPRLMPRRKPPQRRVISIQM